MKKLKFTILALIISVATFAQVGIGTNTPTAGSILELKAADKALLLTRVANTAAVITPVNGMMVYDISTNCIKGYQNGAWTGCLSACATNNNAPSGATCFPWETQLRFNDIFLASYYQSGGISTDGKAFVWGNDDNGQIDNNNPGNAVNVFNNKESPVYMQGAGKWDGNAVKFCFDTQSYAVLDNQGNVWTWGYQLSGTLGNGVIAASNQNAGLSVAKPAGVTNFLDLGMQNFRMFVLGNNGKIYYAGLAPGSSVSTATLTAISNPSGVSGTFKYMKYWITQSNIYMLGNDGNIYSTGNHKYVSGNASAIASPVFGTHIYKVNFPAGVATTITKIDADTKAAFALTNAGQMYTWGQISLSDGSGEILPFYCINSKVVSMAGAVYFDTYDIYIFEPTLMILPTGETSFIDMAAQYNLNFFIGNSGKLYATGYESLPSESGVYYLTDSDPANTNPSANGWFKDYIPVDAAACLTLSKVQSQKATIILETNGRVSGFGNNYKCSVGGKGCPPYLSVATPPMNGNLDANNPRPQTTN